MARELETLKMLIPPSRTVSPFSGKLNLLRALALPRTPKDIGNRVSILYESQSHMGRKPPSTAPGHSFKLKKSRKIASKTSFQNIKKAASASATHPRPIRDRRVRR